MWRGVVDVHKKEKKNSEFLFRENREKPILRGGHVFEIRYLWRPLTDSGYRPLGTPGDEKNGVRTGSISTSGPELWGYPKIEKKHKNAIYKKIIEKHVLIFSYVVVGRV